MHLNDLKDFICFDDTSVYNLYTDFYSDDYSIIDTYKTNNIYKSFINKNKILYYNWRLEYSVSIFPYKLNNDNDIYEYNKLWLTYSSKYYNTETVDFNIILPILKTFNLKEVTEFKIWLETIFSATSLKLAIINHPIVGYDTKLLLYNKMFLPKNLKEQNPIFIYINKHDDIKTYTYNQLIELIACKKCISKKDYDKQVILSKNFDKILNDLLKKYPTINIKKSI